MQKTLQYLFSLNIRFIVSFLLAAISILLTTIFGLFAYYNISSEAKLKFEIVSDKAVIDVLEDIEGLNISFNDKNLNKQNQMLRIMEVRISNSGRKGIRKEDFDSRLGISIDSGQIIRSRLSDSDPEKYITQNLNPTQTENTLLFSPIILEPRQFFTITLLTQHPVNNRPKVLPLGKVFGIRDIQLVELPSPTKRPLENQLAEVFSGTLITQFLRLLTYGSLLTLVMILSLEFKLIIEKKRSNIRRVKAKYIRQEKVKNLLSSGFLPAYKTDEYIIQTFINEGRDVFKKVKHHCVYYQGLPLEPDLSSDDLFCIELFDKLHVDKLITTSESGYQVNNEWFLNTFSDYSIKLEELIIPPSD